MMVHRVNTLLCFGMALIMLVMPVSVYADETDHSPKTANDYPGGAVPVASVETGEMVTINVDETSTITLDSGFVTSQMQVTVLDTANHFVIRASPLPIRQAAMVQETCRFDERIFYRTWDDEQNTWLANDLMFIQSRRMSDGRYMAYYAGPVFAE